jgi:hypothetical protein
MNMRLLDHVRMACQAVAEKARHVQINYDRIASYATSLPLERVAQPKHDADSHYLEHGDDTVAFFLTLDAVNFGSGYFPHLRKRPGMSGYFTIASSLNDYFKAYGPLSAQELAALSVHECMRIFGQETCGVPIAELMQLFTNALNDLGRYVLQRFDGSFVGLVESAGASAERLVQVLVEMPCFNDVSSYDDLQVPFYKRAQITSADLWIAFEGQGLGHFDDLDRLTIFADNLVPHVLRMDGLLQFQDELITRIDRQELLPAGSEEEVEIRACSLHAVELLSTELRRFGRDVAPMKLDYLLWNRGQEAYYKARHRHRTRTVYY